MKNIGITLMIVITLFAGACNTDAQTENSYKTVNAQKLKSEINTLNNEQILDVRTPEEWKQGTLENAILIDWYKDDFAEKAELKLDKTQPVLVYCASGNRSAKAMAKLKEMGYKTILNLDGGIKAWEKAGNKIIM